MSQTQEQSNKSAEQPTNTPVKKQQSTAIFDPMAQEELRETFDEPIATTLTGGKSTGTGLFQQGMADAFEEESKWDDRSAYESPKSLAQIRGFLASFDFTDRSDKSKAYATMANVHEDILRTQKEIYAIQETLSQIPASIRQQIQDDLLELSQFKIQTSDFMDDVRPTF